MLLSDDALILDRSPFRDRHLILTVLSSEHGVIRGVLRNARQSRNAAGAAVQILSLVRFTSFQKPSAEMATFRQIELLRSSFPLSADLATGAATAVVAETLSTFCPLGEAAPRRYRLGIAALDALLEGVGSSTVITYVQLWMLQLSGLFPDIGTCAHCASKLGEDLHYLRHDGLLVCSPCAAGPVHKLTFDDVLFVEAACKRSPAELDVEPTAHIEAWLDLLVISAAERPMRALEFFRRSDIMGRGTA